MTGFFEEKEGVKSMGRLLAFMLVIIGFIVGIVGMILEFNNAHLLAGVFIGSGVVSKVVSKFAEDKRTVGQD